MIIKWLRIEMKSFGKQESVVSAFACNDKRNALKIRTKNFYPKIRLTLITRQLQKKFKIKKTL